ncbi:hypothetical protein QFZ82_000132 [Streptomyces sp. V4I23]|nr:hypothetical protein [Streptomyces sp. V4I23]
MARHAVAQPPGHASQNASDSLGLPHDRRAREWLWGRPLPSWEAVRRGPVVPDRQPHGKEPGWSATGSGTCRP